MAVTATALRELHRIHCQLADLRERLARGPRRVKAREANVAKLTAELAATQEVVKQTRLAADQKQLDLKVSENKIADWKDKLNSCSSNKEYQTLLEQIAAAEMAGSVLADEILEALEKIDQLEVTVVAAEKLLDTGKNELDKCRDTVVKEASLIRGDIERLEAELAAAERELPSDFKVDYLRVIRNKGADGMAEVDDRVCQGCGQQITLNLQNNLMLSKPVFCTACGCLLYLRES